MKKILLFCFYCLSIVLASAQNGKYIPFPSQMIIYGYTVSGYAGPATYKNYRLEIGGDTVINAVHYSKQYSEQNAVAGIRNDVPNKKVYRYLFNTKAEELLYDFDLKVGDTIFRKNGFGFFPNLFISSPYVKIDTAWVSRIDSIFMPHDGLYHKRFNFLAKAKFGIKPNILVNSDKLVEIGTLRIKLEPLVEGVGELYNTISESDDFELHWWSGYICLSIDKKTVIAEPDANGAPPHNSAWCNSIITDISQEINLNFFTIYPNPSGGRFELKTNFLKNNYFEINDVLGKKIHTSKIEKETTEIDLRNEKPGIYFIRIYDATGYSQALKLIIN